MQQHSAATLHVESDLAAEGEARRQLAVDLVHARREGRHQDRRLVPHLREGVQFYQPSQLGCWLQATRLSGHQGAKAAFAGRARSMALSCLREAECSSHIFAAI